MKPCPVRLVSNDGKRGAEVYLIAGSASTYRIRAEKYPDDEPGWFGGKVLWGYDRPREDKALVIARDWVNLGILPDGYRES